MSYSVITYNVERGDDMEIIYAIAEYFDVPNEEIIINKAVGNSIWFSTKAGARYSATTVRGGKFLKKNSIRID